MAGLVPAIHVFLVVVEQKTWMPGTRPGMTGFTFDGSNSLRPADQYPDREHDAATEHDLERGLQERRIHVSRANIGDRPEFEEHHGTGDGGRDPERVCPGN